MEGYKSISGNYIRIDSSGDSEGNFTAFAVKPHNYTFISRITKKVKFSCGYYPIKVKPIISSLICYFQSILTFDSSPLLSDMWSESILLNGWV